MGHVEWQVLKSGPLRHSWDGGAGSCQQGVLQLSSTQLNSTRSSRVKATLWPADLVRVIHKLGYVGELQLGTKILRKTSKNTTSIVDSKTTSTLLLIRAETRSFQFQPRLRP